MPLFHSPLAKPLNKVVSHKWSCIMYQKLDLNAQLLNEYCMHWKRIVMTASTMVRIGSKWD